VQKWGAGASSCGGFLVAAMSSRLLMDAHVNGRAAAELFDVSMPPVPTRVKNRCCLT
jgi:hypothetical protein